MIPVPSVNGPEEIAAEAAFAFGAPPIAGTPSTTSVVRGGTWSRAAGRLSAENRNRLDDLAWYESAFDEDRDRAPAVLLGGLILESECNRLVVRPARRLGEELLLAARTTFQAKQIQALSEWLEGKLPPTLGVAELVLCALGNGQADGVGKIARFVADRFDRAFAGLLDGGGPQRALALVRTRYRNPAAHGLRRFAGEDYIEFCRLTVAAKSFGSWTRSGPNREVLGPDCGILHHQLACARLPSAGEGGWASQDESDLFALLTSIKGRLPVSIVVVGPGSEGPGVELRSQQSAVLRIGEPFVLMVTLDHPAEVMVIGFGSDGVMRLLVPTEAKAAGRPSGPMRLAWPGSHVDSDGRRMEAFVTGPPGIERFVAIAFTAPLPIGPSAVAPMFTELSRPEADGLHRAIAAADALTIGIAHITLGVAR